MTDYARQCAWCHADLSAGWIDGPPAFAHQPESHRYCSEGCALARLDELFRRSRQPGETWVRYCVEVPPEVSELLDGIIRRQLGVNRESFSRANVTRRALRDLLRRVVEVPAPAVSGSAEEETGRELNRG